MFLWSYVKNYWKMLLVTLVLAVINQVFSLFDPQIFRMIVDGYVSKIGSMSWIEFSQGVAFLLLGIVGVAMVSRIAKNFQDYFVNVMTQKLGMSIYQDTIKHIFSLPYSVFEDQQSGQLLQKLLKARNDIQAYVQSLINVVFISLVGVFFVLCYAFFVHRLMGALFLLILPIMGFTSYWMSKKIKAIQTSIVLQSTELAGNTTETIRNVSLIKMLGLESQEMVRLEKSNEKILELELQKVKILRSLQFLQGTMINAMRVALNAVMFWLVYEGAMSLGEMLSLFFYSFYIFGPLYQFGDVVKSYQEAFSAHRLLQDMMNLAPEKLPENPQKISAVRSIAFENVTFGYQKDVSILHSVSFDVSSGKTIAFVGQSGSGKSTILKLLGGLYPPEQGHVLVNGLSLAECDKNNFKKTLGIVTQDTQ
ncbi:MAG TPA: ABC transporter ATP-binding protein, partial [Candidatus Absconditabacterales bacterium]|nr:ABC transporter ATP-binding protein [Candidatus Absconditabacterales bacterium]